MAASICWASATGTGLRTKSGLMATRGQAHAQTFEVECVVEALSLSGQGEGRSRRIAEQEAARRLLDQVKAQP